MVQLFILSMYILLAQRHVHPLMICSASDAREVGMGTRRGGSYLCWQSVPLTFAMQLSFSKLASHRCLANVKHSLHTHRRHLEPRLATGNRDSRREREERCERKISCWAVACQDWSLRLQNRRREEGVCEVRGRWSSKVLELDSLWTESQDLHHWQEQIVVNRQRPFTLGAYRAITPMTNNLTRLIVFTICLARA